MKSLFLCLLILAVFVFVGGKSAFGHGGEDHGDEKPKTATNEKGTISRTLRLGEFEIMLKTPLLEPDAASVGRFFITRFATNEAGTEATPQIEIEAANGAVTQTEIEKTDAPGSFIVKIPALSEGVYTIRAKLTYAGETDTATFSGVDVKTAAAGDNSGAGGTSRLWSLVTALVFALLLAMFGALGYFVWRFAGGGSGGEETVSA